jgi:hypothetical protein
MSDLDDKLREILADLVWTYDPSRRGDGYLEHITQIKQAFADEGYDKHDWSITPSSVQIDGVPHMTGQEFYSRFENLVSEAKKDIKFNGVDTKVRLTSKAYLLLAKKAAGLKNAK